MDHCIKGVNRMALQAMPKNLYSFIMDHDSKDFTDRYSDLVLFAETEYCENKNTTIFNLSLLGEEILKDSGYDYDTEVSLFVNHWFKNCSNINSSIRLIKYNDIKFSFDIFMQTAKLMYFEPEYFLKELIIADAVDKAAFIFKRINEVRDYAILFNNVYEQDPDKINFIKTLY